jgi:hypothetical protein
LLQGFAPGEEPAKDETDGKETAGISVAETVCGLIFLGLMGRPWLPKQPQKRTQLARAVVDDSGPRNQPSQKEETVAQKGPAQQPQSKEAVAKEVAVAKKVSSSACSLNTFFFVHT